MISVESAKKKPVVIADNSTGFTNVWGVGTNDGLIFRLSTPLVAGGYKNGTRLGVVSEVYTFPNGQSIARIQLINPVTVKLNKYTHGYIFLEQVSESATTKTGTGKTYYCVGNSVNVRKSPSTTASKYSYQLDKGDVIGESDGVDNNGFYRFTLRTGDVGYVSKTYCSLQAPASVTVSKTTTNSSGQSQTIQVPVLPGDTSTFDWQKTAIGAVLGTAIAFVVTRILTSLTTKKK